MKWRFWGFLPVWVLLLDLWLGVAMNVKDALSPVMQPLPSDGLPVSPEFAFGWMQVLVNGGMVVLLTWAVACVWRGLRWQKLGLWTGFSFGLALACICLLVFALPAWWQWFWALWAMLQGRWLVDGGLRYVLVSLCQLWVVFLPLLVWYGHRRWRVLQQTSVYDVVGEQERLLE